MEGQDFPKCSCTSNAVSRVPLEGGWGCTGIQTSKSLCTKNSQINISFCIISFFPAMKSGTEEGGGGGLAPPLPAGDAVKQNSGCEMGRFHQRSPRSPFHFTIRKEPRAALRVGRLLLGREGPSPLSPLPAGRSVGGGGGAHPRPSPAGLWRRPSAVVHRV